MSTPHDDGSYVDPNAQTRLGQVDPNAQTRFGPVNPNAQTQYANVWQPAQPQTWPQQSAQPQTWPQQPAQAPWQAPPVAPGSPGWSTAPAGGPPRRNRTGLWVILAAVAIVAVVAAAAVVIISDDATPADTAHTATPTAEPTETAEPEPVVAPSALNDMLLDVRQVSSIIGASPDLYEEVGEPGSRLYADEISAPECIGVVLMAEQAAYQGSGYTATLYQHMRGQRAKESAQLIWRFNQMVSTFVDADTADDFVSDTRQSWSQCANRNINARILGDDKGYDLFWDLGEVSLADDVLSVSMVEEGGGGWKCWHSMSAHSNVVSEFIACSENIADDVVPQITEAFSSKVTAV